MGLWVKCQAHEKTDVWVNFLAHHGQEILVYQLTNRNPISIRPDNRIMISNASQPALELCYENVNGSCIKTPYSPGVRVILYIVFGSGVVLAMCGNLLVVISVLHFKQLHTPANFLIASLASADFLVGISVMPFSMVRSIESCWYFGDKFCSLHSCCDAAFCYSSLFHLCFISIDRYIAVTDPLVYPTKFTVSVSGLCISISWILPLVYSSAVFYTGISAKGMENLETFDCSQYGNGSCPENERSFVIRAAMHSFMAEAIFITVFGNLAMIVSISYFKKLHTPTNFLILSMAVTDFLLGFTIMPYSMVRSVENCWYFGLTFCKIHYSFDLMLSITSIFHLCSVAIDRFFAICHPLRYSTQMTIPVIKRLLLVCWSVPGAFAFGVVFSEAYADGIEGYDILVACSSSCPVMFNKLWGTALFVAGFFTPSSMMIGIYGKIFAVSKKLARAINTLSENENNQMRKDKKAAKTLGIVMGVFLLCWFPCFFTILLDPFLNFSTPVILFDALTWFGYFNSTCNPLIYGFFYPWFRRALMYILLGKIFSSHFHNTNLFT